MVSEPQGICLASIQGEGPSPNRLNSGTGSGAGTIYSLSRKSVSFVWSQEVRAAPQMSTKPVALDFLQQQIPRSLQVETILEEEVVPVPSMTTSRRHG